MTATQLSTASLFPSREQINSVPKYIMIQNKHEESKTVSSLPFQEKVAQTEQKVQFFHSLHIWLTKLESITGYQVGQFKIARQLNKKKKKNNL